MYPYRKNSGEFFCLVRPTSKTVTIHGKNVFDKTRVTFSSATVVPNTYSCYKYDSRVNKVSDERKNARRSSGNTSVNPLNPELNPICCLLALLGAHHFLNFSRIMVKSLTLRLLMSYIYIYIYIYIWSPYS